MKEKKTGYEIGSLVQVWIILVTLILVAINCLISYFIPSDEISAQFSSYNMGFFYFALIIMPVQLIIHIILRKTLKKGPSKILLVKLSGPIIILSPAIFYAIATLFPALI